MRERRVAVTGASGFIGSYLTRKLLGEGFEVVAIDNMLRGSASRLAGDMPGLIQHACDVRDRDGLVAAFAGCSAVFHLAAINGTENFYKHPQLVLDVGVRGALAVVEAAIESGVSDLVVASSAEVYQTPARVPTPEDIEMIIPDPLNPRYSYGGSKLISELIAFNYGRDRFRKLQVFRPHNVYGPDMGWKHVVPQLIGKIANARRDGRDGVEIIGDGRETRAFCYVDDIVDGIITMWQSGETMNVYHIGSSQEVTVLHLFDEIARAMDSTVTAVAGPPVAGATPRRCPDISKMRAIGYAPQVDLSEGIRRTVAWYAVNAPEGDNALL